MNDWSAKTTIGKKVLSGEIKDIDEILDRGLKIREEGVVDFFFPDIEIQLLSIGQARGKFGGGKQRPFRVTQRKTEDGNKPTFSVMAAAGNRDGYIGIGSGEGAETMPARQKATRNAKKSIIKIKRGCGSWQCGCGTPHSIPFKVIGKCGSVRIVFMPAPKGVGLATHDECKKLLELAGVKDVWSKTFGNTGNRMNLIKACFDALKQMQKTRIMKTFSNQAGIVEGKK